MSDIKKIKAEIVQVGKKQKWYNNTERQFITVIDLVTDDVIDIPLSPKQIDKFGMTSHLVEHKQVYVEVEFYKKGEKYKMKDGTEKKYTEDGRKVLRLVALSSSMRKRVDIGIAKETLSSIEDDDMVSHMATVLAGMK